MKEFESKDVFSIDRLDRLESEAVKLFSSKMADCVVKVLDYKENPDNEKACFDLVNYFAKMCIYFYMNGALECAKIFKEEMDFYRNMEKLRNKDSIDQK